MLLESLRQPWLDVVFLFFHYFGQEPGYLIVAPLIYWLRRDRAGLRLLVGLLGCWFANVLLKEWFQEARPFVTSSLTPLVAAPGGSFPSGHAQLAAFFWTLVAWLYPRRWVQIVAAIAIVGIGFCRLYLGVHYPHDVVVGWLVGAAFAVAVAKAPPLAVPRPVLALGVPIVMLLTGPTLVVAKLAGAMLGLLAGDRNLDPVAKPRGRSLYIRLLLAFAVEAAVYLVVRRQEKAAALTSLPLAAVIGFCGFGLLGFWITRAMDVAWPFMRTPSAQLLHSSGGLKTPGGSPHDHGRGSHDGPSHLGDPGH